MTGWRTLAATTIRLANEHGARVRRRPAADRLLCETVDEEPTERVRGILAAAYALSGEICEACGGPGDPVRTAAGRQTTRCADCREPADDILARPPWRRERIRRRTSMHPFAVSSSARIAVPSPSWRILLEPKDLAALMEARYTPATHRGWPVTGVGGYGTGLPRSIVEHAGWNHLALAALRILLPLECLGVETPWRFAQLKEKFGRLTIYHDRRTDFYAGISELVGHASEHVCIKCGRPGRLRNRRGEVPKEDQDPWSNWVRPECDSCWRKTRREWEDHQRRSC